MEESERREDALDVGGFDGEKASESSLRVDGRVRAADLARPARAARLLEVALRASSQVSSEGRQLARAFKKERGRTARLALMQASQDTTLDEEAFWGRRLPLSPPVGEVSEVEPRSWSWLAEDGDEGEPGEIEPYEDAGE